MTTTNGRSTQLVPHAPAQPGRVGQATAVEQSRAVAEVHAAIVVAQQCPRDITRAVRDMHRSCAQRSLAEKAFFRYSRGGSQVSGPSVQLARELARCWGNAQYGVTELRRDDTYKQSEMQAWAWDVETNTRSSTTFIVPHWRDTRQGAVALTDMRDVYENNANMGARRLREMIFAVLPGWFTEDAITACYETLADEDNSVPLEHRVTKAIEAFKALGVTAAMLEQKLGAPHTRWTVYDLAQLQVIHRSLVRGETRKEDEFDVPQQRVTAADITGPPESPGEPQAPAAETAAPAPPGNTQPSPPQGQPAPQPAVRKLDKLLTSLPLGPEEDVAILLEWLCGGPYTATRAQVRDVTAFLEDHLKNAQGDTAEAASAAWDQYKAATAQDAHEADSEPGDG